MTTPTVTEAAKATPTEALRRVETIDLSMIRMKLADPDEGKGWTGDQLDLAEREYRRFLALHLLYPEAAIVPCAVVDEVWHAHILDTEAYAPDCERLFGFFLHHFPYFGMRGEEDAADLLESYDSTIERYEVAFGEVPDGIWRAEKPGKCKRTNCKPQKCK
jgi:hypothetical protein